jgi:hypothetical protein
MCRGCGPLDLLVAEGESDDASIVPHERGYGHRAVLGAK